MDLRQAFLTHNPCYKKNLNPPKDDSRWLTFQQRGPLGFMLHSIGCPQPSAMVLINDWNRADYSTACVHGFIDANNGVAYQTLPWNFRGWHGGSPANDTHIGVEMCEPACIRYTGGSNFVCSDLPTARAASKRTYNTAVELFAHLCELYHKDPLADGVILSHKEGHARGIATNHGDPEHLWNQLGMGYTMDGFRKAVKAQMDKNAKEKKEEEEMVRYKTVKEMPGYIQPYVSKLIELGHIRGRTKDNLDITEDMARVTIWNARMHGVDFEEDKR